MAEPIAVHLLKEPRTIPLLRIIAFSFPFVGIHACINGWFYGMKKAGLPSLAQILEQLTRVGCVFFITLGDIANGQIPSIRTAVFGLAVGELVSMTMAILTFLPYFPLRQEHSWAHPHLFQTTRVFSFSLRNAAASQVCNHRPASSVNVSWRCVYAGLLSMVLPLTANRLTLTLLSSAESVAIPKMLRVYGYTSEGSLSVYGVLTGMALPLILFPNALAGSIAVMLLPMISENYCLRKLDVVRSLTFRTIKYTLSMGIVFLSIFVLFGP